MTSESPTPALNDSGDVKRRSFYPTDEGEDDVLVKVETDREAHLGRN